MHALYLASQSYSRHMLLNQTGITFTTIGHTADEQAYRTGDSVYDMVMRIAYGKMEHVVLPQACEGYIFVLSADTLSVDAQGCIRGKPHNYEDAVVKIKAARDGATVCTGFCIRKMTCVSGEWNTVDEHAGVVSADIVVDIPDNWIDAYLLHQPYAMSANGAIAVEGYGQQFIKRVNGSYTTIIGLPMYEVRTALSDLGFYQ